MSLTERIALLRAEMKRQNLAAFLIPRTDEFQNEYVPANAERLLWLTNFTGSAGMAVVLADKAALIVDSRYTLQAPEQTDVALYTVLQSPPLSIQQWLAEQLKAGDRVGYDAWLHTDGWVDGLEKRLANVGAEAVAVERNLIDTIWADRPQAPMAVVDVHGDDFAGESAASKRHRLAEGLVAQRIDAFAITAVDSVMWLLNVRGTDIPRTPFALSYAILHSTGEVDWFIHDQKLTDEVRTHIGNAVHVHPLEAFGPALAALTAQGQKVAADPALTSAAVFKQIGPKALRKTDPCQLPKAIKNEVECAGIRRSHQRDGVALAHFFAWLDAQPAGTVDELTVMAKLEAFRRQGNHFRDLSFDTIAGSGPNGAIVHYHSTAKTNRVLQAGELLLLDSGGQYRDGTTDVTRTVAIGTPSDEMRERFTLVLKGHIRLGMAVFPAGTSGSQLDVLARNALWQAGLDFGHGTGHGVGSYLSVHEGPQRISTRPNDVALVPGMLTSNEPGYYKSGAYGIRIESLILTQPAPKRGEVDLLGFETVTLCPIDRRLIVVGLLDAAELQWLNAYHATVRAQLTPHLAPEVAAWLETATQPL